SSRPLVQNLVFRFPTDVFCLWPVHLLLAYGNGRASSIPSPLYLQPFSRVLKGSTKPSLRRPAGDAQMLPDPPPRSHDAGRVMCNTLRPHSALGYRPPAPPNSISQPAAVI